MNILVVEDDPISLKLLEKTLAEGGYNVSTATSGKDAINFLERNSPVDIIVSDIRMPVMDGFHLLAYLKAEAKYSRIPVILCSSLSDAESVQKCAELGAVGFMVKPIESDRLIEKIKAAESKVPAAMLVVDDEELIRSLLKRMLEREGLKVFLAESGKEALELLRSQKIKVVLSDIVMPNMNGLELLIRIKEEFPKTKVFLVTGHGGQYGKDTAMSAGADGYISKPFTSSEIIRKIRRYIK